MARIGRRYSPFGGNKPHFPHRVAANFVFVRGGGSPQQGPLWQPATAREIEGEIVRRNHYPPLANAEREKDWETALRHLDPLIEYFPNASNFYRRGRALAELNRFDAAFRDFSQAVTHDSDSATLRYYQAVAALGAHQIDDYRNVCRDMLRSLGNTTDSSIAARILYTTVTVPRAVDDYTQLEALANLANISRLKGALWCRTGKYKKAIETLDQQTQTGGRAWDKLYLALAYSRDGQLKEAISIFDEAERDIRETDESNSFAGWFERVEVQQLRAEVEALINELEISVNKPQ